MMSAPQTPTAELEQPSEVEITEEDFPELSALVDEALVEIEVGKTREWS